MVEIKKMGLTRRIVLILVSINLVLLLGLLTKSRIDDLRHSAEERRRTEGVATGMEKLGVMSRSDYVALTDIWDGVKNTRTLTDPQMKWLSNQLRSSLPQSDTTSLL